MQKGGNIMKTNHGLHRMICLLLIMSMVLMTGCGKENSVSDNQATGVVNSDEVFMTIEGYDITPEILNLYCVLYIFNNEIVADQLNDAALQTFKDKVIEQIKVEYVQYKLATVSDIVIGESDYASIENQTNNFSSYFGEAFLENYGISRDAIYNMFERQSYIQKLQEKSISDLKADYLEQYEQDYGDKVFFSAYYVLFPFIEYDSDNQPVMTEDGSAAVSLNDAEKAKQLEKAEELREKAIANQNAGTVSGNMEALAEEYGVDFVSGTERNYKGAFVGELNEVMDNLQDGEISKVVETDAGYMIIRMDNSNDTDYKEFAIENVAAKSAEALFPTLQSNWISGSGVETVGYKQEIIDAIDIKALCQDMNQHGYSINGGSQ